MHILLSIVLCFWVSPIAPTGSCFSGKTLKTHSMLPVQHQMTQNTPRELVETKNKQKGKCNLDLIVPGDQKVTAHEC